MHRGWCMFLLSFLWSKLWGLFVVLCVVSLCRTPSSYLWFSRLKLYSCYITKFDKVRFEPLCVRSTRSPRFVIDLNFQNFFVRLGPTDSSISVIPRSLSRSRFSISMQPIWTFWYHRVVATACSYASRCHRKVQIGCTEMENSDQLNDLGRTKME